MEYAKNITIAFIVILCGGLSYAGQSSAGRQPKDANKSAIAFATVFRKAVINEDRNFIASHLAYPIMVYDAGAKFRFDGPMLPAVKQVYSSWMTPYLYNLITKTPAARLVKLLKVKKDKDAVYRVHDLLYTGNPADFRYSDDGIYSAKDLLRDIAALKKGAIKRCAKCVARVIEYPIWDCINGKPTKIRNEIEFEKYYEQIVTPVVKGLMEHAWAQHNWTGFPDKGIMLGPNGDIWIGSFGHKNAKGFWVWETKVWALREVGSCP